MKKITSMILALVFAVSVIGSASAKTLKIQLTFPKTSYDGQIVKMWTDRVTKLTRGELKFELLSKGEVVGMKETLEAVDKGLVDGGAAWTHYWSNYHPAAMLFGSPVAGGGIGLSTWMISENTDLELLQEFQDKHTKISELHQYLYQVVIFYQHLKKEQLMLQSGVVQNQTQYLVSKKFLKTIIYKVFTKTL